MDVINDGSLLGLPGQYPANGTRASRLGLRAPRGPQSPVPNRTLRCRSAMRKDVEDEKHGDIMGISWGYHGIVGSRTNNVEYGSV